MAYPWLKLWTEMYYDPKYRRLSDRLKVRFIDCLLRARIEGNNGKLPQIEDFAWELRLSDDELQTDLADLAARGLVYFYDGVWVVTNFAKRQSPQSGAERIARYRERRAKDEYYGDALDVCNESSNEDVTNRYGDKTKTKKKEEDEKLIGELMDEFLGIWREYFPEKPQPRSTTQSIVKKFSARAKNPDFLNGFEDAVKIAAKSKSLNEDGWFNFAWLIRNDDNFQKVLDGVFDFKDKVKGNPVDEQRSVLENYRKVRNLR